MSIPVQNLYHLLTYAWDQLDEAEEVAVQVDPADSLLDLLARVLGQGLTQLLRHGLARDYVPVTELTGRLRGKLLLSESVRQRTLPQARGWCAFDELSADIPVNQLLKSALHHLLAGPHLAHPLREQLRTLYHRLAAITLVLVPDPTAYARLTLHRHQAPYRLLLSVCQLVHEEVLLTQQDGKRLFRHFTGSEPRMASLFERFVRNFYRRRQRAYRVSAASLPWAVEPDSEAARLVLPQMLTDVLLTSATHQLVIDCKYYRQALRVHYQQEKLIAAHLYQLYAYVQHARHRAPALATDGLLLYPVTTGQLRHAYRLPGTAHQLRVATLDLGQNWLAVEAELHELLAWAGHYVPPGQFSEAIRF